MMSLAAKIFIEQVKIKGHLTVSSDENWHLPSLNNSIRQKESGVTIAWSKFGYVTVIAERLSANRYTQKPHNVRQTAQVDIIFLVALAVRTDFDVVVLEIFDKAVRGELASLFGIEDRWNIILAGRCKLCLCPNSLSELSFVIEWGKSKDWINKCGEFWLTGITIAKIIWK